MKPLILSYIVHYKSPRLPALVNLTSEPLQHMTKCRWLQHKSISARQGLQTDSALEEKNFIGLQTGYMFPLQDIFISLFIGWHTFSTAPCYLHLSLIDSIVSVLLQHLTHDVTTKFSFLCLQKQTCGRALSPLVLYNS